jgi:hypothetical protein
MAVQQTAEDKAKSEAQDKAATAAAKQGAAAVADAVKRVADEAVNAAVVATVKSAFDFVITGQPGGRFECFGKGNPVGFSSSGSVLIGGVAQHTDEWGNTYIRGKLDENVKSGEVIVQIDAETKRQGYLNLGDVPPVIVERQAERERPTPLPAAGPSGPANPPASK